MGTTKISPADFGPAGLNDSSKEVVPFTGRPVPSKDGQTVWDKIQPLRMIFHVVGVVLSIWLASSLEGVWVKLLVWAVLSIPFMIYEAHKFDFIQGPLIRWGVLKPVEHKRWTHTTEFVLCIGPILVIGGDHALFLSMWIMAFADPCARLFGILCGRNKLRFLGKTEKTWEGSLSCLVAAWIIGIVWGLTPIAALFVAMVMSICEALPEIEFLKERNLSDNVTAFVGAGMAATIVPLVGM